MVANSSALDPRTMTATEFVKAAPRDSWHRVAFNGVELNLPAATLQLYSHCAHGTATGIRMVVEHAHAERMLTMLYPNSLFLDVGASTGAITVPLAKRLPSASIIAFEPAKKARKFLLETLKKNKISNVTVLPYAISDRIAEKPFVEYLENETCPFQPDVSCLAEAALSPAKHETYDVQVRTIDSLTKTFGAFENLVIKIDVNGFECHVLRGAERTIQRYRPFLSIDIHRRFDGRGTTEREVRRILGPTYEFERLGHTLICTPEA